MGIIIREFLGEENLKPGQSRSGVNLDEYSNSDFLTISKDSIMVDIEAIHEHPFHTRNYTRYTKEALINSIPTWTKPYCKPLIMHHNDKDGKIIGRIHHAEYDDKNTFSGTGALTLTANIPDSDGKTQVEDGRLMTTSIGVLAHDVRCSICNHNIAEEGECEHDRGVTYDGQVCYWDIYEMEGKELSYVIVPSDIYSKNKKIYKPNSKLMNEGMEGAFELNEDKNIIKKESTDIDELIPENEEVETNPAANPERGDDPIIDELTDIKIELASVKKDLESAISDLQKERDMREALEEEIVEHRAEKRLALENELNDMRESLNKPKLPQNMLERRTDESLLDSIVDLKEVAQWLEEKKQVEDLKEETIITKIESPALEDESFTNEKDLKETKDERADIVPEVDLSEEVEKLFSGILGSRSL